MTLTLTLWPWGHQGMLTLTIPTYDAFSALSYQNCRSSSQKCEKMPKIDQFITRTSLTAFWTSSRHMPGSYFFKDACAWAISWRSDIGKVVKIRWQTDVYNILWRVLKNRQNIKSKKCYQTIRYISYPGPFDLPCWQAGIKVWWSINSAKGA